MKNLSIPIYDETPDAKLSELVLSAIAAGATTVERTVDSPVFTLTDCPDDIAAAISALLAPPSPKTVSKPSA